MKLLIMQSSPVHITSSILHQICSLDTLIDSSSLNIKEPSFTPTRSRNVLNRAWFIVNKYTMFKQRSHTTTLGFRVMPSYIEGMIYGSARHNRVFPAFPTQCSVENEGCPCINRKG